MDMVFNCVNDNGFVAVYERVPIEECSSDFLTIEDMDELGQQRDVSIRWIWSQYGQTEQHWQRYATDDAIERMIADYNREYGDYHKVIKATESNIKDIVMSTANTRSLFVDRLQSNDMHFGSCNDRFVSHSLVIRIHEFDSAIKDVVARLRKSGRRSIDHGFDYEFDDRVDYMNDKGEIVNKPLCEVGYGYNDNISSLIEYHFRDRVSDLTNNEFCIRKNKLAYTATKKPRKTKNQITEEKYGIDRDTMRDIRYAYAVIAGQLLMEHLGLDGEFTYPSERKNQVILRQKMHELNHTDEDMMGRLKKWHSYQLSDHIQDNLTVEQIKVAFDHIAVEEAEKKEREAKKKAKAR